MRPVFKKKKSQTCLLSNIPEAWAERPLKTSLGYMVKSGLKKLNTKTSFLSKMMILFRGLLA